MAVSTLSQTMRERYSGPLAKARTDDKAARRCDIYVVSYTSGLIQGRLLIARELWKHGLAADLVSWGSRLTPAAYFVSKNDVFGNLTLIHRPCRCLDHRCTMVRLIL